MLKFIQKLRVDSFNIEVLNYISMLYLFSLMVSYKLSGTIFYVIFLIFLLNENVKKYFIQSFKNRFVQACLAYFLVIVIWTIGSDNLSYALAQIKINKFFLFPIIFMAIIREDFIKKFFYIFIIGVFINICWSYLIFFGLLSKKSYLLMPLDQSFIIFLGIVYSLYRILQSDNKISYQIALITIIFLGTICIFMLKTTEMVLYPFVIFVTLIYIYRKNLLKIATIFLIFIFFLIGISNYFLDITVKNKFIREAQGIYNSVANNKYRGGMAIRLGVAKYSLEVMSDNLFFGVGTGDHSFEVREKLDKSNLKETDLYGYEKVRGTLLTGEEATLHNTYLQILVQFGLIGFLVYLNIFYQVSRYIKGKPDVKSGLILVCLVIVLLRFNTGWDFQFGNLGKLFILTIVILISTEVLKGKKSQISEVEKSQRI